MAAGLDPAQGLRRQSASERAAGSGGALWRRPWLKARLAPLAAGPCVRRRLHRGAGRAVRLVVLDGRLVHRAHHPQLDARQLPRALARRDLPHRRGAHDPDRGGSDRHRRDHRLPVRLLHGAARRPRLRAVLFVLVLLPLWASYLARVYAWQLILNSDGCSTGPCRKWGCPSANIAYTNTAMWIVFSYIWLPFMILPVYAALERIPHSYIEASRDLGAKGGRTLRSVILPLALPGHRRRLDLHVLAHARRLHHPGARRRRVVASSSATSSTTRSTASGNLPFAAAFAVVPVVVMGVYL